MNDEKLGQDIPADESVSAPELQNIPDTPVVSSEAPIAEDAVSVWEEPAPEAEAPSQEDMQSPTEEADVTLQEDVQPASEETAEAECQPAPEVPHQESVQNPQPQYTQAAPPYGQATAQQGYSPYRQPVQYPYQNYAQYRQQQMQQNSYARQNAPFTQQPYGQQNYAQQQPQYYHNAGIYPNWQQPQRTPMQNPYGMPVQQPKKKEIVPLTPGQKKIVRLLQITAILLSLIFVYCIVSDVVQYSGGSRGSASSEAPAAKDSVVIEQESKPVSSSDEKSTDGAYTVAEVAALVSPSIAAIHVYADELPSSAGSGIILTEDGYILTNAHVVSEGDAFEVLIEDDIFEAEMVGYDSKSDLAVLRVDADGLTPATLGDSDELIVGEEVVAIGSPAGLTGTVTNGIVSALNRQIRADQTGFYMDCIQTNAAISPGNSGGALVNMYGQVIGVTSSKYASLYGTTYEGLGFAISINQAMPIAEELIEQGYISGRVRIGITFVSMESEEVAAEFSELYKLEETVPQKGVWIQEVSKDCDIADSGLEINDLILSVEGQEVNNYDELCAAIEGIEAGVPLEAECRRYSEDGTYEDFTIEFKLMKDTSGDY